MKLTITILLLILVAISCSTKHASEKARFPDDQNLLISWNSFKDALNTSDTAILKSLSNPCIYCSLCTSDQSFDFMSSTEFYIKHFGEIFNPRLLSFINDSSKVSASYDESIFLERDSCLSDSNISYSSRLANIHVSIPIPNEEGLTVLIHFIETKAAYKFYGISTIP
jgi:hypothetical protein